jgi:galactoside O-acetyltransferase
MKEKLHTEELYVPDGEEIMSEQLACLERLYDFNATRPLELKKRTALLK